MDLSIPNLIPSIKIVREKKDVKEEKTVVVEANPDEITVCNPKIMEFEEGYIFNDFTNQVFHLRELEDGRQYYFIVEIDKNGVQKATAIGINEDVRIATLDIDDNSATPEELGEEMDEKVEDKLEGDSFSDGEDKTDSLPPTTEEPDKGNGEQE